MRVSLGALRLDKPRAPGRGERVAAQVFDEGAHVARTSCKRSKAAEALACLASERVASEGHNVHHTDREVEEEALAIAAALVGLAA